MEAEADGCVYTVQNRDVACSRASVREARCFRCPVQAFEILCPRIEKDPDYLPYPRYCTISRCGPQSCCSLESIRFTIQAKQEGGIRSSTPLYATAARLYSATTPLQTRCPAAEKEELSESAMLVERFQLVIQEGDMCRKCSGGRREVVTCGQRPK